MISEPILFNILINDLEHSLSKFEENKELKGVTDTADFCDVTHRNLNKLEKLTNRNFVRFSKEKCQVLHLGRNSFLCQYRGSTSWKAELQKSFLRVLVDAKLTIRQQCTFSAKINSLLGCVSRTR